jgi:hypothetical protein
MELLDYRKGLRVFLRDHAEMNRLLKFEEENADDSLDLYINMALGYLNNLPPRVANFGYSNFPIPSLLIHQAAVEALVSNGILQSRNEITYNNGGISVKVSDKSRYLPYINELNRLVAREMDSFFKIKISINVEGAWGGVSSPYSYIAGNPTIQTSKLF